MNFTSKYLPYRDTNAFSSIVLDYLDNNSKLRPYYHYTADLEGIKQAITGRKQFPVSTRRILTEYFNVQYSELSPDVKVKKNIDLLGQPNTYTVCTAHQPNIFTGHLYFIYKIIHAIKLADELNHSIPECHFVPVFYMGSEDADLEELGQVTIHGKKYVWKTNQQGAVGQMKIDQSFIELLDEISGQLSVEPYGPELVKMLKGCYQTGKTIAASTFALIHELFANSGLLVLLPGSPVLKKVFVPVIKNELTTRFSAEVLKKTVTAFPPEYKIQAIGRDINLFYLKENVRERIESNSGGFKVSNTDLHFTDKELLAEVDSHPERLSPNVILRPLYQETILPNVAFIGGGGELAYWLELKDVFSAVDVPFPVLILRNSFMIVPGKVSANIQKLGFKAEDLFQTSEKLMEKILERHSSAELSLDQEISQIRTLYESVNIKASAVDITLEKHVSALSAMAEKKLTALQKKMIRSEKKKFEAENRQITKIKETLFPGGLQERVDNFMPYYAKWGRSFIDALYKHSYGLQQQFCIIEEVTLK